jgi:hypothetical protein
MRRTDPNLLPGYLDALMEHGTAVTASKVAGISRTAIWRISNLSENNDPDFPEYQTIDWGGTIAPFHVHLWSCLDQAVESVQQEMTFAAWRGRFLPVFHSGFQRFQECEYAMSLTEKQFEKELAYDDQTRDLLGVPKVWPDKMKRVWNSDTNQYERQPLLQFVPPSVEIQSKVLSALAPTVFGDKRSVHLDGNLSLGVTVIGEKRTPPPEVQAVMKKQLAAPVPPVISHDPDSDLEPDSDDETPFSSPASPTDAPLDPEHQARRAPTALERDLAIKAAELKKRTQVLDDDNDPRRMGYGPPPTGYKLA